MNRSCLDGAHVGQAIAPRRKSKKKKKIKKIYLTTVHYTLHFDFGYLTRTLSVAPIVGVLGFRLQTSKTGSGMASNCRRFYCILSCQHTGRRKGSRICASRYGEWRTPSDTLTSYSTTRPNQISRAKRMLEA